MPLFLCDREFVSDQRWRVDMNEFYEELKKVLDLSDGDVWTETVLCGKDAGKKRILSGIFAQDEEQNERPDEKKKENREKSGCEGKSRIFRERIGRIPRLVICGGNSGRCLGLR